MRQGLSVEFYLPWVKTQDTIKRTIKLLVMSEQQPYRIYHISCFHRYVSVKSRERNPTIVISLFYVFLENDTSIVSTKTEGIAQCGTNLALLWLTKGEV